MGGLTDAIDSLKKVPREYVDQDIATTSTTSKYDNATLSYGPDAEGWIWNIHHRRKLNWKMKHNAQASVTKRFVGDAAAKKAQ